MKKTMKQINYTMLYGVVLKKTKKYIKINYGMGKIKIFLDELPDTKEIQVDYTISVGGFLVRRGLTTGVLGQNIGIFDKHPHYIRL